MQHATQISSPVHTAARVAEMFAYRIVAPSALRVAFQPFSFRSLRASSLIVSGPPSGQPPNAASSNSTAQSQSSAAHHPAQWLTGYEHQRAHGQGAWRTLQLQILDPIGRVHMENTLVPQQSSDNQLECLQRPSSLIRREPRAEARCITFRFPSAPVSVLLSCFMYFTPSEKS